MGTHGKTVLMESGKRALRMTGKAAVFDANGDCVDCCCHIFVLASFVTNAQNPVWELAPYQMEHLAAPGAYWRLIEVGSCYPPAYPWYGAGCVNDDGKLEGLPNQFVSSFPYNGHIQLQIGCRAENDEHDVAPHIDWPGDCSTPSPVYEC